jgi:hypothetical protein
MNKPKRRRLKTDLEKKRDIMNESIKGKKIFLYSKHLMGDSEGETNTYSGLCNMFHQLKFDTVDYNLIGHKNCEKELNQFLKENSTTTLIDMR